MIKGLTSDSAFNLVMNRGYDFFVGVPDSLLKDFLKKVDNSGIEHVVATNEAHAVAIAFGAILGGRKPVVYLQNSGLGNIINPLTSLCIPANIRPLLVIGHRHTLPQHKVMGEIDYDLLQLIGYKDVFFVSGDNNVK